ncbi:lipolytic protein G-D-S-L family [Pseudopedobacter saltans DSM 12145]|uniref:Lipolytic protein G-D-S-L family n=1 Tax=Pseudopedobacter saltans (strain ATCC 51119 / DSM 12145 / JCM 21818 / CCUG 39354 / LMG 10337 / NBRC 100064 / NCIMB 13643) TaxID=762903 RepID=F0SBL3_PSESL|nr:SGNH/GDSL hydrolase family protein [Pseudopedobacter saltans]ADY51659.1 lipolytic protein G-D-S-L family [Pseudopedobacter saltans DSM 12145]
MKKTLLTSLFLLCLAFVSFSQDSKELNWIDFQQDKSIKLQGQLWSNQLQDRFDRLPAAYENKVRKEVWNLSKNSAGIYLDFHTTSDSIALKYKYQGKESLKNMTSIGVSGVDLYAYTKDKRWIWVQWKYVSFKQDDMTITFGGLKGNEVSKYRLYFPLYNSVSDFKIGLNKNAQLTQLPNTTKPIIVYGTSIAQGASASRAGLAWTAFLGRKVNAPVVNLGFSGNGRLEKELVDLIAAEEASIYVIDCLPNLTAFSDDEVYQRLMYALITLRSKHPKTPIVFTEHADATIDLLNNNSQLEYQRVNRNFRKFVAENISGKDNNVYVVSAESIGLGVDDTIDGVHPSDMGMKKYADAYFRVIQKIH